jgi:hypothetical protein
MVRLTTEKIDESEPDAFKYATDNSTMDTVVIPNLLTTSSQLALDLFDEMLTSGRPITESPKDIGFRRNSVFVDVQDLSLVPRRALDAAHFIASQDSVIQESYSVDINYFKWLMMYSSGNKQHFRSVMKNTRLASIDVENESVTTEEYVSVPLIGKFGISGTQLKFEIDPIIQKLIKDPLQSNFFSLRTSNLFTITYARSLYDHLLEYTDAGITEWLMLSKVREWLNTRAKTYLDFRYLKRDGLEPALKQINEHTHMNVSYTTGNVPGSKKIERIRFKVVLKDNCNLQRLDMLGSKELYDILRGEFGLSPINMEEILMNRAVWSNDRIHQAIDFVRYSIERKKVTKSVSGFFMKALRDNLIVSSSDIKVAEQLAAQADIDKINLKKISDSCNVINSITSAAREQAAQLSLDEGQLGLSYFNKLLIHEKSSLYSEFISTQSAKLLAKRMKIDLANIVPDTWIQNEPLALLFGQFVRQKLIRKSKFT